VILEKFGIRLIFTRVGPQVKSQRHLDIEFFCPLSGVKLKTGVIPPHKMSVLQCDNGSLFARCPNHVARCFVADITTVNSVMEASIVVKITTKNSNKQERSNGESQT
jgi:hypothetical protein